MAEIKKNLTIRLSDTEKGILEDLAMEQDMSKAEYVRYLILKAKEENEIVTVVYNSNTGYKLCFKNNKKNDELSEIEENFNKSDIKINNLLKDYEIFAFIDKYNEIHYKVPLERLRDIYKIQQALIK